MKLDPWNTVKLGGRRAPGPCRVRWREKSGGYIPGEFEICLTVRPENAAAAQTFVRRFLGAPKKAKAPMSYAVEHPELRRVSIRRAVIMGLTVRAGVIRGTKIFALRAVEYVPAGRAA